MTTTSTTTTNRPNEAIRLLQQSQPERHQDLGETHLGEGRLRRPGLGEGQVEHREAPVLVVEASEARLDLDGALPGRVREQPKVEA